MNCSCRTLNTDATIGSTFVLQFRLLEDDGTVINLVGKRVLFAVKSESGETLLTADSSGASPKIELDAIDGATIAVDVPESMNAQVADYNVLFIDGGRNTPVIRGKLELLTQIADPTP